MKNRKYGAINRNELKSKRQLLRSVEENTTPEPKVQQTEVQKDYTARLKQLKKAEKHNNMLAKKAASSERSISSEVKVLSESYFQSGQLVKHKDKYKHKHSECFGSVGLIIDTRDFVTSKGIHVNNILVVLINGIILEFKADWVKNHYPESE